MNAEELQQRLSQFYGTENYFEYKGPLPSKLRFFITDGVKFLIENADCYWLLDSIISYQYKAIKDESLKYKQFWSLKVNADKSATLICERDENDIFIEQKIEYTDFPLPEIRIWVGLEQENTFIFYLPSEH